MVMFTNDTYEKIMYEKILSHADCDSKYEIHDGEGAIQIANYGDGENLAIECLRCNEVIIDFDKPGSVHEGV